MSETRLAALSKPQSFGNRSQLKTWLIGILKHKVIDLIRSNARLVALPDACTDDEGDELDRIASRLTATLRKPPTTGATLTKPGSRRSSFWCWTPAWNGCRPPWAGCF